MIVPRSDQRMIIFGPTGCGKTTLARVILAARIKENRETEFGNVLAIDPKRQLSLPDSRIVTSAKALAKELNAVRETGEAIIYRPTREELNRLDYPFELALARRDTFVYIDELYYIAQGSDFMERAPNYYYVVTTGRSLNVGVMACVQRPRWVPIVALSESDLRSTFYVRDARDQDVIEGLMGPVPWDMLRGPKLKGKPNTPPPPSHRFVQATDTFISSPMKLRIRKG